MQTADMIHTIRRHTPAAPRISATVLPPAKRSERLLVAAIYAQQWRFVGGYIWYVLMLLFGVDIHPNVKIARGLRLPHCGGGIVIHSHTEIGQDVMIQPGVTIGRADVWNSRPGIGGFVIEDDVVLSTGAKILGHNDIVVRVGKGTVVGANAVLNQSTGEFEIWAGAPARRIGDRPRASARAAKVEALDASRRVAVGARSPRGR